MKSISSSSSLFAALLLAGGISSLSAQITADPVSSGKFEPGFSYSRGSYGLATDTEVYSAPLALSIEEGPWTLRGAVAWLSIKGPATVTADSALPNRPTTASEAGLGDFSASLAYKFPSDPAGWVWTVTGRVKFPTANEDKGLGTGQTDYYGQIDLMKSFPSVTPFFTVGYRWLGNSPRYPLENGAYAAAGLAFPAGPKTTLSVGGEWRQAVVSGADDAMEASVSVFQRLSDTWTVSLNALKGFNDASPDFGFGITLGYAF